MDSDSGRAVLRYCSFDKVHITLKLQLVRRKLDSSFRSRGYPSTHLASRVTLQSITPPVISVSGTERERERERRYIYVYIYIYIYIYGSILI